MSPSHFHPFLLLFLLPLLLVGPMYAKSLELWDFTVNDGLGGPFSFAKLQHVPVSACTVSGKLLQKRQQQASRCEEVIDTYPTSTGSLFGTPAPARKYPIFSGLRKNAVAGALVLLRAIKFMPSDEQSLCHLGGPSSEAHRASANLRQQQLMNIIRSETKRSSRC